MMGALSEMAGIKEGIMKEDPLLCHAVKITLEHDKISTSFLQRSLKIGYNRAALIIEQLEQLDIVSKPDEDGKRIATAKARKLLALSKKIFSIANETGASPKYILDKAKEFAGIESLDTEQGIESLNISNHAKEKCKQVISKDPQDNTKDVGGVAGARLLSFVERIERLEQEKSAIMEDIKEVYAEAKGVGFDVKTMRKIVKLRKMDSEKRSEEETLLDLYSQAVGLQTVMPL